MVRHELLPEEHRHQQELLLTIMRWALFVTPPSVAVYVVAFVRQPSWPALIFSIDVALIFVLSLWGSRRVRRERFQSTARILLALILVIATGFVLFVEERLMPAGAVGLAIAILFAMALEPARLALRWACVATVMFAAALFIPRILSVPRLELGAAGEALFVWFPPLELLLIAFLGRSTTHHLRGALSISEAARVEMEQSSVQLKEQKAELQSIEGHLTGVASSLDQGNRELQGLAQVVSSDLRTPLQTLHEYSRRLEEECAGRLDEVGRGYIQDIAESARHMDALVSGLLVYSSLGASKQELDTVEVGPLLERLVTALRLRERADVQLPADAPTVRAHGVYLEQIFSNLLDNAAKFQREGVRPVVAVEWADRGDAWELAIRDNGIGINPLHFEKIFGIFERLHLQSEYEGTGIGLAIVKKGVEEHGGKVWVESVPGQGSVFRFTLPKPDSAPSIAAPAMVESVAAWAPRPRKAARGSPQQERVFSSDERRRQERLLLWMLRLFLVVLPVLTVTYLITFSRDPSWRGLAHPTGTAVMFVISAWCTWSMHRGKVLQATRVFLASLMAIVARYVLFSEGMAHLSGALGLSVFLLAAISLDHPSMAFRWLGWASALYVGGLLLRDVARLPPMGLSPAALGVLGIVPVLWVIVFAWIGHSTIQHLRVALTRSRSLRRELRRTNQSLEVQKAELLKKQAHLSALTTSLGRRNRELQSLAYVAAHDLRAPLRALNNYGRFLQEDCAAQLDDACREYLAGIAHGARQMDALVSDLLEYSRIGRVKVELGEVDLAELVERVVAKLRLRDTAEVHLPADLPTLRARRERLQQIFSNLLENAVKFRRPGVPAVVSVECADRGDAWELAVRDNGIGIDPRYFDRSSASTGSTRPVTARERGWVCRS